MEYSCYSELDSTRLMASRCTRCLLSSRPLSSSGFLRHDPWKHTANTHEPAWLSQETNPPPIDHHNLNNALSLGLSTPNIFVSVQPSANMTTLPVELIGTIASFLKSGLLYCGQLNYSAYHQGQEDLASLLRVSKVSTVHILQCSLTDQLGRPQTMLAFAVPRLHDRQLRPPRRRSSRPPRSSGPVCEADSPYTPSDPLLRRVRRNLRVQGLGLEGSHVSISSW